MASYLSYNDLEYKISQIKNDEDGLCHLLDNLSTTKDSSNTSRSSYHTALCCSYLSLDSYVTAAQSVEELNSRFCAFLVASQSADKLRDDGSSGNSRISFHSAMCGSYFSLDVNMTTTEPLAADLSKICEKNLSVSISQVSKKSVTFSEEATFAEEDQKVNKTKRTRRKITTIKNKFIDYINRESFYLKYKFQRLKKSIKISQRASEKSLELVEKASYKNSKLEVMDDNTSLINLKIFFTKAIVNFILETNIDDDTPSFLYKNCSFQQTDLSPPISERKQILNTSEIVVNKRRQAEDKINIHRTNAIEPKLIITSLATNDNSSVCCDVLQKYLMEKVQYPIQLKIANSIIKLKLPAWFQNSLIS